MTENNNYNEPDGGSSSWHIPLNENFQRLDTDVEVRDLDANLSSYTPKDGAKFLAEDTGAVYIGDGSSWSKIGVISDPSDYVETSTFDAHVGEYESHRDEVGAHIGSGANPSQGEFSYDGDHVYVGTGGSTKNLTNIGTGDGGGVVSSIPADVTLDFDDEWAEVALVDRPLAWGAMGDRGDGVTIYVSPNGNYNAAGTQSDPYSITGVLESLPLFMGNLVFVDLYTVPNSNGNTPVTYEGDHYSLRAPTQFAMNNHGEVRFIGNPDNPSDVRINGPWHYGFFGKGDHGVCRGIQFQGGVQHNGYGRYVDCNLYNRIGAFGGQCLTTKQGKIILQRCNVGEGNNPELLRGHHTSHFKITGCDFNSSDGTPFEFDSGSVAAIGQSVNFDGIQANFTNMTSAEAASLLNVGAEGARLIGHDKMVVSAAGEIQVYEPAATF